MTIFYFTFYISWILNHNSLKAFLRVVKVMQSKYLLLSHLRDRIERPWKNVIQTVLDQGKLPSLYLTQKPDERKINLEGLKKGQGKFGTLHFDYLSFPLPIQSLASSIIHVNLLRALITNYCPRKK